MNYVAREERAHRRLKESSSPLEPYRKLGIAEGGMGGIHQHRVLGQTDRSREKKSSAEKRTEFYAK